jgi:para-nitrobenzyl esterase
MIGSNADEMSLSAPKTVLPFMVTALIKKSVPTEFQSKALELYPPSSNSAEAKNSYIGILTDAQFTVNARRTAECISQNQTEPVWRYFFTHKHTIPELETLGSYHGMELFYVFNNWENTLLGSGLLFKPEDESVQNAMLNYWVNFADTGNPNAENLDNWPRYQSSTDCFLEIKATPDGSQTGLRTAQSDLWDKVSGFSGCTGSVFSENVPNLKTLQIYPNPSKGIFLFNMPKNNDSKVAVFNSSGQRITIPVSSNKIDLQNQNNGIYYLEIKTNDEIFRGKIIKIN